MNSFFITGTDTDVGKTYVLCELIRVVHSPKTRVLPLKPIASGGNADVSSYEKLLGSKQTPRSLYTFAEPIAPHLAAKAHDIRLSAAALTAWCVTQYAHHSPAVTLIEGAGGLMVPLNQQETWIEFIHELSIPVIVVVGIRLGCINHALMTEQVLMRSGCKRAGWIANHLLPEHELTDAVEQTLKEKMETEFLGSVAWQGGFKDTSVIEQLMR